MSEMADEQTPGERIEAALEMWEDGMCIMRENLRRRRPQASDDEIEDALVAWRRDRPGDADGVVVAWPRHR